MVVGPDSRTVPRGRPLALVVLILRIVLAALFLTAALAKLAAVPRTAARVRLFGIPEALARPVAVGLPALELVIAALLIMDVTARAGGAPAVGAAPGALIVGAPGSRPARSASRRHPRRRGSPARTASPPWRAGR